MSRRTVVPTSSRKRSRYPKAMKLLYAAFVRLPTEKAHGAQIVRTCEALAGQGAEVELVVPDRATDITQDAFTYYGAKRNFTITILPVPDFIKTGRIGFLISAFFFARRVAKYATAQCPDTVYSRDKIVLIVLRFLTRVPLVWEVHGREPYWAVRLLRTARIIAITAGLQEELVRKGVALERICVAHDGVDLAPFVHRTETKEDARQRLGLPLGKKVVMYIGRLDGWKGVGTLLKASELLPADIQVAVIGGEPSQVEELSRCYPRIIFPGFLPYRDIANNEAAADVLV